MTRLLQMIPAPTWPHRGKGRRTLFRATRLFDLPGRGTDHARCTVNWFITGDTFWRIRPGERMTVQYPGEWIYSFPEGS